MTMKSQNKNISAENEDVIIGASLSDGVLTFVRKNLYDNTTSEISFQVNSVSLSPSEIANLQIDLSDYDTSNDVDGKISDHDEDSSAHSTQMDLKLNKNQTSFKGKNVVVDSTTGEINFEDKNNHTHSEYLTDVSNITLGYINGDGTFNSSNGVVSSNSVISSPTRYRPIMYDNDDKKIKSSVLPSSYIYHIISNSNNTLNNLDITVNSYPNGIPQSTVNTKINETIGGISSSLSNKADSSHTHDNYLTLSDVQTLLASYTTTYTNINIKDIDQNIITNDFNMAIDEVYYLEVDVKDANGNAVSQNITLNVDKGYLIDPNNNRVKSLTKTGSSVQFPYLASEWGYTTFWTDNAKTQSLVTGWKTISETYKDGQGNPRITLYSDGKAGLIKFYSEGVNPNAQSSSASPFGKWIISESTQGNGSSVTKPLIQNTKFVEYSPLYRVGSNFNIGSTVYSPWYLNTSGQIFMTSWGGSSSATSVNIVSSLYFPLKQTKW